MQKAVDAGHRVVVQAGSRERVEHLSATLWTYDPASWLPHGSAADGDGPMQPVWLTDGDDTPNGATVAVLTDGREPAEIEGFARCLDLFDGTDADAVAAARERWKRWKAAGHELVYYQQGESGGWEEKARS